MDLKHMGCHAVEGLECSSCKISSCCHPYMRTPVSYEDAHRKKFNLDYLTEDKKAGMYFLNRFADGTCIYFDKVFMSCRLEPEYRPTSCLVFPVRLKEQAEFWHRWDNDNYQTRVILNMNCPSAYPMAQAFIKGDQSVIKYIKTAIELFEEDSEYTIFVLNNTVNFKCILDVGSLREWREDR